MVVLIVPFKRPFKRVIAVKWSDSASTVSLKVSDNISVKSSSSGGMYHGDSL